MAFDPMMLLQGLMPRQAPPSSNPLLNNEERDLDMYKQFLASRGEPASPIQSLVQGTVKSPEEQAVEDKMGSIQGLMERRTNLGQRYRGMRQAASDRGIRFNPIGTPAPSAPGNIQPMRMANPEPPEPVYPGTPGSQQGGKAVPATGGGFGPSSYGYSGKTGIEGTKGSSPYGFQPEMWSALTAANAAMKQAGLGNFGITDGWRSYAAQVDVKRRKGNLAATPGSSIHGLGLAADLSLNGKQLAWLKANGAKFGLKNLPSESWHWQLSNYKWGGK